MCSFQRPETGATCCRTPQDVTRRHACVLAGSGLRQPKMAGRLKKCKHHSITYIRSGACRPCSNTREASRPNIRNSYSSSHSGSTSSSHTQWARSGRCPSRMQMTVWGRPPAALLPRGRSQPSACAPHTSRTSWCASAAAAAAGCKGRWIISCCAAVHWRLRCASPRLPCSPLAAP